MNEKRENVVPIYKSNDRQKCENDSPISILPLLCKILKRSVFD